MKFKPTLFALFIAALPMAAQAGQASERSIQLHEPLSTPKQATTQDAPEPVAMMTIAQTFEHADQSTAMAKARANLSAQYQDVPRVKASNDALQLSLNATK